MSSPTTSLFVRGMSIAAIRRAKAEAARRGETLGRVLTDALRRSFGAQDEDDALAADVAWFEREKAALARRYRCQWVAIVNRAVVDHDRDFGSLSRRVFAKYGVRSIFMPRVDATPVVRLRSPRVRRIR